MTILCYYNIQYMYTEAMCVLGYSGSMHAYNNGSMQ